MFDEAGRRVAVTVIEAGPCVVVQRKTQACDGYDAVQLGFGETKERRVTKAAMGRFRKAGTTARRVVREFFADDGDEQKEGDTVSLDIFEGVERVDVTGVTKGRGFAGVVRRHGMHGGPKTHGGHSKRRVGAIGQCAYPARVAKGRGMPGHMGHVRTTQQNLKIVARRPEDNVILIHGAVPGPSGSVVLVKKALKRAGKAE